MFRIVEFKNNKHYSLFHSTSKNRLLETNKWLIADKKLVRDGSGDNWYISGWHTFLSKNIALKYLNRFKHKTDRIIIECKISGNIRKKSTNKDVYLSDKIYLIIRRK